METLTRLVSESFARHGFDRPLDYRRLQWSRWFRCESHHSLLAVPSKPGVFALAEEVVDFGSVTAYGQTACVEIGRVETGDSPVPRTPSGEKGSGAAAIAIAEQSNADVEQRRFSTASGAKFDAALAAVATDSRKPEPRRVLAVSQFFEDDDMAFALDRMISYQNPVRTRLASGCYFVRYVVIEDPSQRRSICTALNQWIVSSAEKVTGIGAHFATSLELTEHNFVEARVATGDAPVARSRSGAASNPPPNNVQIHKTAAPELDSGAAANIHCPSPFPSGF